MRTSSRDLAVVLFDEVEVLDVAAPIEVVTTVGRTWNWRPFRVATVASRAGRVATRNQLSFEAAFDFGSCPKPEVVIVPGGYGARREDAEVVDWLRGAASSAENFIAIGNGVLPLARAGLLTSRVAAIGDAARELAGVAPRIVADATHPVIEDGKVISARDSASAIDAGLVLLRRLFGDKIAVGVAQTLGHAWGMDAGAPEPSRIVIREEE